LENTVNIIGSWTKLAEQQEAGEMQLMTDDFGLAIRQYGIICNSEAPIARLRAARAAMISRCMKVGRPQAYVPRAWAMNIL